MPSMLGIVLGVLFASGTTLGAWYVAFDAGMVRNDPASAIAGAAGVFAYYDDEEEEIDVDFEEDSVQDPNGNSSWPSESEGADGADDGSWWWEDDDVEVEVDVEDDNGGSWWWEDDDGDIEPSYDDEIYIDEPYYYDDVEEVSPYYDEVYLDDPYYYDDVEEYEVIDEWDEYEVVQNQRAAQQANQPWYVKAFPGIGSMLQQILPGQQAPAPRPPPPVQQRPTYPQPSCWVSAQPSLVASGGSSVISWASFNATRASLTGFGEVSVACSRTVPNITSTRTFTLSVAGQGGNGSCYTRVTVQPPVSGPPSCLISVNPDVISRGESANLAWGSQNASSATLSGTGPVPTQGGVSVSPIQTTTYTLTVGGSSGQSSSCTVRLFVD